MFKSNSPISTQFSTEITLLVGGIVLALATIAYLLYKEIGFLQSFVYN